MIYLDNVTKIIHNINIYLISNIEKFYFKLNNYYIIDYYIFFKFKNIYINHI